MKEAINKYAEEYDRFVKEEYKEFLEVYVKKDFKNEENQNIEKEVFELPSELYDFTQVLLKAANIGLHQTNNWLKPDGRKCSHKEMHASIFRHVASSCSGERLDKDTGLDHLLHAACRCMMMYCRLKKGIVHPDDIKYK